MATTTVRMAKPGRPTPTPPPAERQTRGAAPVEGRAVSEGEVRVRAYTKWVSAGRPLGDGVNFWLEAERELRRGQ